MATIQRGILVVIIVAASLFWTLAGAGCAPASSSQDRATPVTAGSLGDHDWPFWPAFMRVHPLSRVAPDPDPEHPVVEVRIEFTDRTGDTTKATGRIQIDLYRLEHRDAEFITQWVVDLADPSVNNTHWDVVTRTYLFKLDLEPERIPHSARIHVRFLSVRGEIFEHTRDVTLSP